MRKTLTPCAVTKDKKYLPLERVRFGDRRIAEAFLQEALNENPALLPVDEIDTAYGPLASLGREIIAIDNLFITPTGRIALVETKLWRNPESGREVVGQILDYASRLGSWSYEDLQREALQAMQSSIKAGESLHEYVKRLFPDEVLPESEFIDAVQKTLQTGRFLLLIVGDGIREGVERMLDHLHDRPQQHFTFGLVEIGIYENPDVFAGRILLPSLVAKTKEVVRAVVRVETTGQAQVSVTTMEEPGSRAPGYQRRTLSEDEFLQQLPDETTRKLYDRLFELADELGAERTWRSSSVSLRLPAPDGSKRPLTLLFLTTGGEVYTGHLKKKLKPVGLPKQIGLDHAKRIASLFENVSPRRNRPDFLSRNLTAQEVNARYDDFADAVRETVDEINGVGHM